LRGSAMKWLSRCCGIAWKI